MAIATAFKIFVLSYTMKLKNITLPLIVFVVALIFLFFTFLLIVSDRTTEETHHRITEKIYTYIQLQKKYAVQLIHNIISLHKANEQQWLNDVQAFINQYSNDIINIAIYKNDTAIFWNHNDFVPETWSKNNINFNSIFVNSTWAYVYQNSFEQYTIVAFIPIKKEYPFENKHLKNYYFGNLDINYDYSFSLFPESSSYFITDDDGSLIFSITPKEKNNPAAKRNYFIGLLILSFLFVHLLIAIKQRRYAFTLLCMLILLRLWMQLSKVPSLVYQSPIFSAELFTSNAFFSSLGDAFFNSWIILLINELFFYHFRRLFVKSFVIRIVTLLVGFFISWLWINIWHSLIFESSIHYDWFNISELSFSSVLALIIVGIFLYIFLRYNILFISYFQKFPFPYSKIIIPMALTIIWLLLMVLSKMPFTWSSTWLLIILFYLWFIQNRNLLWSFTCIILVATFVVIQTLHLYNHKKENLQKVVAVSLSSEKDVVAQMLLLDMEKRIRQDKILQGLLNKAYDNRYEIYKYLKDNYFYGFWNKYDLQVTICSNFDNLRLVPSGSIVRCFDYFNKTIQTQSQYIDCDNFYGISQNYSEISFLGKFCYPYFILNDTSERCVFIELTSKLIANTPGYPDLLMDLKTYQNLNMQWKNYAKYKNLNLIQKKGDLSYPQIYNWQKPKVGEFITLETPFYRHIVYAPNKSSIIVVSSNKTLWHQYVWAILCLFNLYAIIFSLFWIPYYFLTHKHDFFYGFRFKYISSFLLILIVSYILIAIYTLVFFNYRFEQKNLEQLQAKNQSMLNFLEEQIGNWTKLFQMSKNELTRLLITTSNIFYGDINIFLPDGKLYATSRPEFFEKGLKSKLIDPAVFTQIAHQKQTQYIHNEKIGSFEYLASYTVLTDKDRMVGVLQFPYFTEQEKFRTEITSVLINLVNIYVLFAFLAFGVVLLIANSILKPITYLQSYFKKIRFGKHIKPIVYHQHDEIKPLVIEYNRMLEELARSTEKLLLSERESAWRDIARQIAHEIKNPLTPMKLNIQYLLKQKKEKGYIPEELLRNTMQILLEQIESLSSIASAFSTFARMPSPNLENFDIVEEIRKAIHLFSNSDTIIKFTNHRIKQCLISGDKEYIQRIMNNLLTNAIQAVPPNRTKDIIVSIQINEGKLLIAVSDNGIGINDEIAPNIFKPSFTTKSSGMGMGLSLVKNMVEMMHGRIYFTSVVMQGTTFYIELPYKKVELHE